LPNGYLRLLTSKSMMQLTLKVAKRCQKNAVLEREEEIGRSRQPSDAP